MLAVAAKNPNHEILQMTKKFCEAIEVAGKHHDKDPCSSCHNGTKIHTGYIKCLISRDQMDSPFMENMCLMVGF